MNKAFKIITCLVFIFLYLPLCFIILNSFNACNLGGHWGGWTLHWYERVLHNPDLWESLYSSLNIAFFSTLIALILGTCTSFAIYLFKSKLQTLHKFFVYTPLIVPEIHMGISLLMLFIAMGIQLGTVTIIIAHTSFCMSYVTMVMLARLENFDFSLIESAQDLGARSYTLFMKVILPAIRPGLISSALLSFTLSLDDFVVTFFVAGAGSTTLPLHIYSLMKNGKPPELNALSTLLILATFLIAFLIEGFIYFQSKKRGHCDFDIS